MSALGGCTMSLCSQQSSLHHQPINTIIHDLLCTAELPVTLTQACEAVRLACAELVSRLQKHTAALGPGYTWQQLIRSIALPMYCKV